MVTVADVPSFTVSVAVADSPFTATFPPLAVSFLPSSPVIVPETLTSPFLLALPTFTWISPTALPPLNTAPLKVCAFFHIAATSPPDDPPDELPPTSL